MGKEILEAVLEFEKWPKAIMFIIRTSLYWPILSGFMLYYNWHFLVGSDVRWFFLLGVLLCTVLSFFYCYAWKKYGK